MEIISTSKAPAAAGPYSQAIRLGKLVFISGQIGISPETGLLAEGLEAQCVQAIKNLGEVLAVAGLSYVNVVKTTCFLKNMNDFAEFNKIYASFFTGKPARSCAAVSELPKGALVEIEAIASAEA
jgi:2-iminobutanoate/2-iminopropanoate deaminase